MERFRRLLAVWSLAILGPVFVLAPLLNPEIDDPWFPVLVGLAMTAAGILVIRAQGRAKGASPAAVTSGPSDPGTAAMRWSTNAPSSWPALELAADVAASPGPILTLRASAALKQAFEAHSSSLRLATLAPSYLLEHGVIEAAFEIADDGRPIPVFLYPEANTEAASHFSAVRQAFAERKLEPVYFAPSRLEEAPPLAGIAAPLAFDGFTSYSGDQEPGHYSMWWPSTEDPDWRSSACMADIERLFRALDGREPWIVGFLLQELEEIEEAQPVALPDDLAVFATAGPEGTIVLFSASAEKGLRLHFHESTQPWVRDRIWRHVASFCEQFRGQLDEQGVPELPSSDENRPLDWWILMRQTLDHLEKKDGQGIERVGAIPV